MTEYVECLESQDPMPTVDPAPHKIDYTNRKVNLQNFHDQNFILIPFQTVVVIDKDHFCLCKRFIIEDAPDEAYANLLNIPIAKVRIFKHKMQIFEDRIRGRRRAARLNCRRMKRWDLLSSVIYFENLKFLRKTKKKLPTEKINDLKKQELTSVERYKCARDLIMQNYTTREISKVLKISIRSVTRFRKRIREAKKEMVESGEIEADEMEEEWEFKHLSPELKGEEIFQFY